MDFTEICKYVGQLYIESCQQIDKERQEKLKLIQERDELLRLLKEQRGEQKS
jgi:hypothetical protein